MNGWSAFPAAAALPERVLEYPPLLSSDVWTAALVLFAGLLVASAVHRLGTLRRVWRGRRIGRHFRPAHT